MLSYFLIVRLATQHSLELLMQAQRVRSSTLYRKRGEGR